MASIRCHSENVVKLTQTSEFWSVIITHISIGTRKVFISLYRIYLLSFRSKLYKFLFETTHWECILTNQHLQKFTSGFIGPQSLNFDWSLCLSPRPNAVLFYLAKFLLRVPVDQYYVKYTIFSRWDVNNFMEICVVPWILEQLMLTLVRFSRDHIVIWPAYVP